VVDRSGTLGARFDPRANALNLLRLLLALEVVLWHAYALPGSTWLPPDVERFLGSVGVDGFFAISVFLICRSWAHRPVLRAFLLARARRLLPGLWACLAVTAFVLAPLGATFSDVAPPALAEQTSYVVGNAAVWVHTYDVGRGVGNGSLWSLLHEVVCYLVVVAAALCRVTARRAVVLVIAVLWCLDLQYALLDLPGGANGFLPLVARTGLLFACGSAFYLYRDLVPLRSDLTVLAVLLLAAGVVVTPDYRTLGAPALGYLLLHAAVLLGRYGWARPRHDLSYGIYLYGYPVQQVLLAAGATGATAATWPGFAVLSVLAVLPFAAASWWLVERPSHGRRRASANVVVPPVPPVPPLPVSQTA
jgi:peptidoglycan/LPS O-acetylase OafA/YrhL